ncbi:MAG: TPM domain-containing protein [Bacteroides sp.]|nr:TPM domain-containing protein [Bacteroides sp.]MBD5375316.1 TPM domain-containing protein [Bacteroides sp.]
MRKIMLLWALLMPLLCLSARSVDDIPNVHLADRTRYVSNPDGVLSEAAVTRIDSTLARVWGATSGEVVVVAIDEMDSGDIDTYATELFTKWGIGKKDNDNGLLLLISKNDRKAVIRTGYGMEGVLPDIVCGRILRNEMFPRFKEGDYDGGTLAAVGTIAAALTDPQAAAEIRSKYANDSGARSGGDEEDFSDLLNWALIATLGGLILMFVGFNSARKLPAQERYFKLATYKPALLAITMLGLGLPVIAYLILAARMKRLRNGRHLCPNCSTPMKKLSEERDNDYLTPAQDTEEKLNSVDYDVWVCPQCNETDIIPYDNPRSTFTVCPQCGAKACTLEADRVVRRPTPLAKGAGIKVYNCRNCHNRTQRAYEIPKVIVPPVIIGGGGFGGGGGGGFSGGSFGGGMTGGGGASGGW